MAKSNEPFFWGLFSAGMAIGAFFVPALIVITGMLAPYTASENPDSFRALINHPLTRIFLFVVISLSFFHWAHRFRFMLIDLGLKAVRTPISFICYGAAFVGTIVAGLVALQVL